MPDRAALQLEAMLKGTNGSRSLIREKGGFAARGELLGLGRGLPLQTLGREDGALAQLNQNR